MNLDIRVIVYTIPAFGHINAMLGVIDRMVSDGYKVKVYSTIKFKSIIEDTGAEFVDYGINDDSIDLKMGSHLWEFQRLILRFTCDNIEKLTAECKEYKADLILHDSAAHWGLRVGELLKIKSIALCSFIAVDKTFSKSYFAYAKRFSFKMLKDIKAVPEIIKCKHQLRKRYGFKKMGMLDVCLSHEKLHIITYDRYMQPGGYTFSDEYFFLGPASLLRKSSGEVQEVTGDNNVFVSLGTINDDESIYKEIIELVKENHKYFKKFKFYILDKNGLLDNIDNKYIKTSRYYNQKYMLEHCDMFITACGINSVSESIFYKTPMLMYPQQGEQDITCEMALKIGVGIKYSKRKTLREQLYQLRKLNMDNIKSEIKINELMDKISDYIR